RAAVIALLLAPKEDVMQGQLDAMKAAGLAGLAEQAKGAAPLTRRLGAAFHLPVIDLALPAIKSAPDAAKVELLKGLEAVINADRRVSLPEFVVLTLARHQLAPTRKPGAAGSKRVADLRNEAMLVLSLIAHAGVRRDAASARDDLQAAVRAATKEMSLPEGAP